MKVSRNHKWLYYLRKTRLNPNRECLENSYGQDILKKALIVCHRIIINNKDKLRFRVFNSTTEFLDHANKQPDRLQCFYEVIFMRKQKPHFDIDIDLKNNREINDKDIVKSVIDGIISVLSEYEVEIDPIKDILIFQSHGKDKKSYHIVVDHYYHSDNINAYCFYKKVLEKVPGQYRVYIDRSVYKTVQQFRMIGNRKYNTERVKKYLKRNDYIPDDLFRSSLISYIRKSKQLPPFEDEEEFKEGYGETNISIEDGDIITKAMDLLSQYLGISKNDSEFPFFYDNTVDNFIILKRIRAYECRLCQRTHENENPFMFIHKGYLYWNCRRHENNKSTRIGKISTEKEIEEQKELYPEIYNFFDPNIKVKENKKSPSIKHDISAIGSEIRASKDTVPINTPQIKGFRIIRESEIGVLDDLLSISKQTSAKIRRSK